MSVTRQQAEKLTQLYSERQEVQKARDLAADRNFWLGIATDAFKGTGTRSIVLDELGGAGEFASLMLRVVPARFEEIQQALDAEISENGGQP